MVLASCHQSDDVVANLKEEAGVDVPPPPPIEDAAPPRPDVTIEPDASPPTIDREVPPPPPDVAEDTFVPPPPVDAMQPPPKCEAAGPILSIRRINGDNSEACAGQLAAHIFTHALCACGDLNLAALLSTGSFDSSAADNSSVNAGAAVGIAGEYPSARSNIGGSLTVAGTSRQPTVAGGLDVQGDLRLAGGATFFSQLSVKRDTWIVSPIGYWGVVNIGRNLHTAPGAYLTGLGPPPIVQGDQIAMAFTVEDPCGCAERLDVAEMERLGAAAPTDNAARSIEPTLLSDVSAPIKLDLPCGRFRFDSIGGAGAIQLTISGRTAIFVDGNVNLTDSFQLAIAPGVNAELDWFIRGNLSISIGAKVGDLGHPSATRIYVGGTENTDIVLSSGHIGANIYAPTTNVNLAATGMLGSIYAKNLSVLGGAFVRYDRAILNQGVKCQQPLFCDKCHTCNGGTACMGSTCKDCIEDSDCCAPLVCEKGSCQPLLFR